ncbi:MAG: beta-L-arabinofuranosidase domain-containing protein, partial [Victivallales bacterium]
MRMKKNGKAKTKTNYSAVKTLRSKPVKYNSPPVLEAVEKKEFDIGGEIGRLLAAVTEQWILPAPQANPGMLAMFRERDRMPLRNMVPWAGEFAGKYLTHASQILSLTRNPRLKKHLHSFVREMISCIDDDGYIGPWPKAFRLGLNGNPPNCGTTWDAWGHYHAMLGLLKWHDTTNDPSALTAACKIADLLCSTFLGTGRRLHEVGDLEMNMAPYHSMFLLYMKTGEPRYLEIADEIERDFEKPPAGDYVRTALQGMEFCQTPKPRWESLHAIQGIAEKYFITGDMIYRRAFEHLWRSMQKGDRHNNGGFSSGERATGNPYGLGAIETCCTVAWTAMSVDMLRMSGDSKVADELELSLFNSGLGLINPSGRWVTYDTPMEGRRVASAHSIVFQARPATPELNCCSVNGPRMLGMLGNWALMQRDEMTVLNYYGPCSLSFKLPSRRSCRLIQETDYPRQPLVKIKIGIEKPESFKLALRIPSWSEKTIVRVAGQKIEKVSAGQYLVLDRKWKPDDSISIQFDIRPHYWVHEHEESYPYTDWETEWNILGPVHMPSRDEQMATLAKSADPGTELKLAGQSSGPGKMKSSQGLMNL